MSNVRKNVEALNQEILNGNILGAFDKYYAENCVMQENAKEPREGKKANRDYEEQFVNAVEAWHDAKVLSVAADEENQTAAVEWHMEFTMGGNRVTRRQVAIQQWDGDKIVQEKFYYGE